MKQTKTESFIEACINTAIGFVVSYTAWPVAAWLCNVATTHAQQVNITLFFTVLSVARSYVVRRWCDKYLKLTAHNIALTLRKFCNAQKINNS